MNVSATASMQQTQLKKMDGTGGQGSSGMNRMMLETLSMLPEQTQTDIKSLMQTLDPAAKQDSKAQMAQIESANMTVEDLTAAIMDIFKPSTTTTSSSYPSSFSVYA
jgi:hypothetical protein